MIESGFFDLERRMEKIDKNGDSLVKIARAVDWEIFRPDLKEARGKERRSNAGADGYDVLLMFKILIFQSLYDLSDDALEFQILDRQSFMRFLGLHLGSKVPDATTVWRFREDLIRAWVIEGLFKKFDQRNSREEDRQKDVDARWAGKNGESSDTRTTWRWM